MTDCFALLGLARRPWLDIDLVKERFHRLTAQHHPDVSTATGDNFPGIIAAYNTLRDPKARIRHLLELEVPDRLTDSHSVPADLLDLFPQIANARANFGKVVTKLDAANAPLALALLAGEKLALLAELKAISNTLQQKENALLDQLRELDAQWPEQKEASALLLAEIHQRLSFLLKWADQLREAIHRLEM